MTTDRNEHRATARGKLTTMTDTTDTRAALDAAIRTFGLCAYSPGEPSAPDSLAAAQIWTEIEAYGHATPLRAAIAADRDRAVEFAVDQAAKPMARRMAAEIVTTDAMISYVVGGLRAVGLLRVGPGDLDAVTWTRLAKAIDEARRVPSDLRVTPDEARRLVDAYGCDAAMHGALGATGDTRAALLRALGVEGVEA